jgi:hypothetical protein
VVAAVPGIAFQRPAHNLFGHVLSAIAPAEFKRCLFNWVNKQITLPSGEIVALAGKPLRDSHN